MLARAFAALSAAPSWEPPWSGEMPGRERGRAQGLCFVGLEPVDKSVGELENNGVKILLMAALQGCPSSWSPILQMEKLTPSR